MSGFFEELQRRKVYRVAAAYIIAAEFLIQIASAAFPAWELPNWSLRLVIALLLIGFPIALILAWAYDITPKGIQVTPIPSESTPAPQPHLAYRRRGDRLHRRWILSTAAGVRPQDRQVSRSSALSKFEQRSRERFFGRWHPG
jgi:hypothetical protein